MNRRALITAGPVTALAAVLASRAEPSEPQEWIELPFLGVANAWTWEQHMEWLTDGMTPSEKAASYAKHQAIRDEQKNTRALVA